MKQKTRKSLTTRFKVTKNGKVLRRTQYMRHLRRKKSKAQIRRMKVPKQLTGKMRKNILRLMGEK